MILLCSCCFRPPKPEGWYATLTINGEIEEAYCCVECREAHHNQECACFVESDRYEMLGDEVR